MSKIVIPIASMLLATSIGSAPAAGVWTRTGNLNQARFSHTAALLNNGKVLVIGGQYQLRHAKMIYLSEL